MLRGNSLFRSSSLWQAPTIGGKDLAMEYSKVMNAELDTIAVAISDALKQQTLYPEIKSMNDLRTQIDMWKYLPKASMQAELERLGNVMRLVKAIFETKNVPQDLKVFSVECLLGCIHVKNKTSFKSVNPYQNLLNKMSHYKSVPAVEDILNRKEIPRAGRSR